MSDKLYPEGIDCVWIAADGHEHVGAFITAGVGPVPSRFLGRDFVPMEELERLLYGLPKTSGFQLLVTVPRPDSFVELAERGLFVYDWTDIHKRRHEETRCYEKVAVPLVPLKSEMVPATLASFVMTVKFAEVTFSREELLDPRIYLDCVPPVQSPVSTDESGPKWGH